MRTDSGAIGRGRRVGRSGRMSCTDMKLIRASCAFSIPRAGAGGSGLERLAARPARCRAPVHSRRPAWCERCPRISQSTGRAYRTSGSARDRRPRAAPARRTGSFGRSCRFWVLNRSASSSIEPLRSAKSTVTCLRSPSRAVFEVRIFSGEVLRGVGVGRGEFRGGSRSRGSDKRLATLPTKLCVQPVSLAATEYVNRAKRWGRKSRSRPAESGLRRPLRAVKRRLDPSRQAG